MGLLGLFKKKSSDSSDSIPDIDDLPPIPTPNSLPDSQNVSEELPPVDKLDGDLSVDNLEPLPEDSKNLMNSENKENDSVLPESNSENVVLEDSSTNESKDVSNVSVDQEVPVSTDPVKAEPKEVVFDASKNSASLPVFQDEPIKQPENSNSNSSTSIDVDSLSVPEVFVKKEDYVSTLKILSSVSENLESLMTSEDLFPQNNKFLTLISKASNIHTSLNKDLLSIEGLIAK